VRNLLKFVQALGIAVTGLGLVFGIVRGSEGDEFLYASIGIALFFIARFVENRID
jgi:hypothetical protein